MPSPFAQRRGPDPLLTSQRPQGQSLGELVAQAQRGQAQQRAQQDQGTTDWLQMALRMRQMQQDEQRGEFYRNLALQQEARAAAGEERAERREQRVAQSDKEAREMARARLELAQQAEARAAAGEERAERIEQRVALSDQEAREIARARLELAQQAEARAASGEERAERREQRVAQSDQEAREIARARLELAQQAEARTAEAAKRAETTRGALGEIGAITGPLLSSPLATPGQLRDSATIAMRHPEAYGEMLASWEDLVAQRYGKARKEISKHLGNVDPTVRPQYEKALMQSLAASEEQERSAFARMTVEQIQAVAEPNMLANAMADAALRRKKVKADTLQTEEAIRQTEMQTPSGYRARGRMGMGGVAGLLYSTAAPVKRNEKMQHPGHEWFSGPEGRLNWEVMKNFSGQNVVDSVMGEHSQVVNDLAGPLQGPWSVAPGAQPGPIVDLIAFPVERSDGGWFTSQWRGAKRTVTVDGKSFEFEADPETLRQAGEKLEALKAHYRQLGNKGTSEAQRFIKGGEEAIEEAAEASGESGRSVIGTMVYNNLFQTGPKGGRRLPASASEGDILRGRDHLSELRKILDKGRIVVRDIKGKELASYANPWSDRALWLREQGILQQSAAEGRASSQGRLSQAGMILDRKKIMEVSKMVGRTLRDHPVISKIQRAIDEVESSYGKDELKMSPEQRRKLVSETFDQVLEKLMVTPTGAAEAEESELFRRWQEADGDIHQALDSFVEDVVRPHAHVQFNRAPGRNQRNFNRRDGLFRSLYGHAPQQVPGNQKAMYARLDSKQFQDNLSRYVQTLLMDDRGWLNTKPVPAGKIPSSFFLARPEITNAWNAWGTAVPSWFDPRMTANPDMMDLAHAYSLVQQDLFRNPGGMNNETLASAMEVLGMPGPFTPEDAHAGAEFLDRRSRALQTLLETNSQALADPLLRTIAAFLNAAPRQEQNMPMPGAAASPEGMRLDYGSGDARAQPGGDPRERLIELQGMVQQGGQ